MKNKIFTKALLLVLMPLLGACAASDDANVESPPGEVQSWTAVANAVKDSVSGDVNDEVMRALFYGGNTRRYINVWDQGDVVTVYQGNTSVGTMSPTTYGTLTATLTGTLNGSFTQGETLGIYLPSRAMTFTGQKGTIYDLSSNFAYQLATTTVQSTASQILTLSDIYTSQRQPYFRFVLTASDTGARLHPSQLTIMPVTEGGAVLTTDAAGNVTSYGTLVITPEEEDGEYPEQLFVAMINKDNATFKLIANVGSDVYVGPLSTENAFAPNYSNGQLVRIRRKMLKTTPTTSLTIEAIPDRVFTGSAHTPTLTVKDGETTLALDTDYSVAYTANTNVGTATATIKGLADKAEQFCTTPYLGTKEVSFTILRADPAVTLDGSDVVIDNNGTSDRQVTAVTIADGSVSIMGDCSISYSSSDPTVATVDAATGKVTGVSSGTCTITATVASADNWNAATASYQVTVHTSANGTNSIDPWGDGNGEGLGGSIKL